MIALEINIVFFDNILILIYLKQSSFPTTILVIIIYNLWQKLQQKVIKTSKDRNKLFVASANT